MTSLSTRFLGQPRLTKPTFKRVSKPGRRLLSVVRRGRRADHCAGWVSPSIVADRTAAADARLPGSGLARFRFRPRGDVREQIVAGESVLALLKRFEVGRQLSGTERGPFLNADVVLKEERQVDGDDVPSGWRPVHYAVKPVDSDCLGLIEPHVP